MRGIYHNNFIEIKTDRERVPALVYGQQDLICERALRKSGVFVGPCLGGRIAGVSRYRNDGFIEPSRWLKGLKEIM